LQIISSQKCENEIIFVFGFGRFHHILISNVILIRNQFYFLRGKILDQLIKEEEKLSYTNKSPSK
jgi:hypothetical protein